MRLSNKHSVPYYNFLSTALIVFLLLGILAFVVEEVRFDVLGYEAYLLIIVPIALNLLFYLNGRPVFEYDSDGEALNFRNRSVIPFGSKPLNDEFPKYKLINYQTISFLFFKRLYITVQSKNTGSTILKYEISYLTAKELNDLEFSLAKVVKKNKQNVNNE